MACFSSCAKDVGTRHGGCLIAGAASPVLISCRFHLWKAN